MKINQRYLLSSFILLLVLGLTTLRLSALPQQQQQQCQPPVQSTYSTEPNIFTEEQETILGDAISEHLQRRFRIVNDAEVTAHLSRIGERIIKHLPPSKLRFQFFLVDLPEANAFVLPGGRIYVSRKLVAFAQSEDELAGVISHEIGHLVARQGSIRMTRLLQSVLNVNQVGDRRDIFAKYNQLMENAARRPKVFVKGDGHGEKEQIVADQIGLYALARAGYDPQAHVKLWERFTETKGQTGSFFSDLFGTTKPEVKRLREMAKIAATLPAACIETSQADSPEEFKKWQAVVVNYTGSGRREALHSVLKKTVFDPPLRGDVTHLRFSPDGKYVLAQDDSGISVLSREPFAFSFRIQAPEAKPAQFTPDAQHIVFHSSTLRVEHWSVARRELAAAHEVVTRKSCLQSALAPDGKTLACLDSTMDLNLFDVATSKQFFQKKSFYVPHLFDLWRMRLMNAVRAEGFGEEALELVHMNFSPDGRYFAAGQRTITRTALNTFANDATALAFDLTAGAPISVNNNLKKLISGGFTFFGPDRLIGIDRDDVRKSALVSFPAGEVIEQISLPTTKIAAPTRGNFLLLSPVPKFPLGVLNLATKTIFKASKQPTLDIYDEVFVAERSNGEVGLYGVEKNDLRGKVLLPRNLLGPLRAAAVAPDLSWLALSERTRGAVWNVDSGERLFLVRGFSGGYFDQNGALFADFPKFEADERGVGRLDPQRREAAQGPKIQEAGARQYGPFILSLAPAKKDGGYEADVLLEMRAIHNLELLWSRAFTKEAPLLWVDPLAETMVLAWAVSTAAAKSEIKNDVELNKKVSQMKEKEGDYLLQIVNARSGKALGQLLIETGKGSFRISDVLAFEDWVVISDTQNRVLVYSLRTGEEKGKVFGRRAAINPTSNLLCVENESGNLTIYDLTSLAKRDEFTFPHAVALTRFSADGRKLLVVTADQTAYILDVSSKSARQQMNASQ